MGLAPLCEPKALELEERVGAATENLLVRGDNLAALEALLPRFEGRVDFVYVDPPFATGEHFGAFDDRWPDLDAYLAMLAPRLRALRALLSPRGSMVVHLDWHAGHLVRRMLGDLFGEDNSLGEIIWAYGSPSGGRAAGRKLVKAHDVLYWFARERGAHIFHPQRVPYSERYLRDWFRYVDDEGRRYRKRWRDGGRVERQYLDESPGMPLSSVWNDIQQVYADPRAYKASVKSDVTGYPTQKPVALLERLVGLASDPGGIVLDAFCGSGTTLVAAARLGRAFVGIDAQPRAVHVAHKRLVQAGASFDVLAAEPAPEGAALACRVRANQRGVEIELDDAAAARADRWSVVAGKVTMAQCVRERGKIARAITIAEIPTGAREVIVRCADAEGCVSEQRVHLRVARSSTRKRSGTSNGFSMK